jgi:histidyl-tRNA synthetase
MSEKFQVVRGMRDFLPELAVKKQFIEDACRKAFEKYGFLPLETPVVEEFGLLAKKGSGGEAVKDEIYYFKDKGKRELGLRFDLTVPLARVVASNPQIPKPFKRYQIADVYRYDRPGASRYRKFTQADIDIVGSSSIIADFECIAIAIEILDGLGLKFKIRLNNRKLLEEIALACSVSKDCVNQCFRCIDKLDKIGKEGVARELKEKGIGTKILLAIEKKGFVDAKKMLKQTEGLSELGGLLALLEKEGLEKFVEVDLSLARGLEYYTGNVFEIAVEGGPSVGGGGRYDNLVAAYGGQPTPAVGISLGVDRLLDVLEERLAARAGARIFVVPVGREMAEQGLELVQKIRALGIPASMDLNSRGISKNLDYACKMGIPFVAILGENEAKEKCFTLKDMKAGKEQKVKIANLKELNNIAGP